jgi:hypothetical protein
MRIATALVASLFGFSLVLAACGDSAQDAEPFDTLQACFDDHHNGAESLPVAQAITVCCLDHPIAGVHPSCKDTMADCVTHVDAELDSTVLAADIQAACTDYISQK